MSTLLLKVKGNWELNRTIWPPHLFVYDDLLIYKKRRWFHTHEITLSYSHIVRVNLNKGIFFSHLELVTSADENILVKFIWNREAATAKKIIDQKIFGALAKHQTHGKNDPSETHKFEMSVRRLEELLERGRISEKEFEKKRLELLKDLK